MTEFTKSQFVFDPYKKPDINSGLLHISVAPILADIETGLARIAELKSNGYTVSISFPFISRGNIIKLFSENFGKFANIADGFTLQNFADYEILTELFSKNNFARENFKVFGDYSLNVTNSESAKYWGDKLDSIALLPEMDYESQLNLAKKLPSGMKAEIATGEVIVSRSEHCFAVRNQNFKCGNCGKFGLSAPDIIAEYSKKYGIICNNFDCNCILTDDAFPYSGKLPSSAFDAENIIIRY